MFGRQDDVIKQDQKRKADVALPDATLEALTTPPATSSATDNPDPASPPPTPPMPMLGGSPFDGFIGSKPSRDLPSPIDLAKAHQQHALQANNSNTDADRSDTPTVIQPFQDKEAPAEEPIELSYDANPEPTSASLLTDDHSQPETASSYLDKLRDDNPDLMSIKQSALEQLAPLVDQLQLAAEDKFKTLIMLIQASDNQALIPAAYEAARQIENNERRAQALLDVVNEINYFTRNSPSEDKPKADDYTLAA